jgi:hypothetical protein
MSGIRAPRGRAPSYPPDVTHPTWRLLLAPIVSCGTSVARILLQGLLAYGASMSVPPAPPGAGRPLLLDCPFGYVRRGQREVEQFLAAAADEFRPHGP